MTPSCLNLNKLFRWTVTKLAGYSCSPKLHYFSFQSIYSRSSKDRASGHVIQGASIRFELLCLGIIIPSPHNQDPQHTLYRLIQFLSFILGVDGGL
jgi:hypothetical protein